MNKRQICNYVDHGKYVISVIELVKLNNIVNYTKVS